MHKHRSGKILLKTTAKLEKELAAKNHELGIEAALEKVRVVAMKMKEPDDLLDVCKTLYKQLLSLGFVEIRNAMVNIHNDTDKSFINYDYSDELGKSTNHLTYTIHPLIEKQIKKIRSTHDAFSETYFTGKDLTQWKKFRKKIGEKDDPRLKNNKGLYYYLYSIGTGSIGISTFGAISTDKKALLKRFSNVFQLSYQRYLDITKAEAQAREAQIEAALERVRSRTMAMHRSEEIADIVGKIFGELRQLDLVLNRVLIWIFNANEKYISWWSANPEVESNAESYRVDYNEHPVFLSYLQAWKSRLGLHLYTLSGDNKKTWEDHLFSRTELSKLPKPVRKGMREEGTIFTTSTTSDYGLMMVGSFEPLSAANTDIIERFGRVFQQSYTRYLDVQKAEAQAREAQIEASLERVRAKTMAMQKSEELQETTLVLFQQFKSLKATTSQVSICVFDEDTKMGEMFVTLNGEKIDRSFPMELDKEVFVMKKAKKAFLDRQKTFSFIVRGKQLQSYNHWRNTLIGRKGWDESIAVRKQSWYVNGVFFSRGMMGVSSDKPPTSAALQLLDRFASVFDLTFTRFLDLQKAEAQAREAKIEAALERVRAKSMAMHRSDEVHDVANVLFQQLRSFGGDIMNAGITLCRKDSDEDEFWLSSDDGPRPVISIPHTKDRIQKKMYADWKNKSEFFSASMGGPQLRAHYEYMSSVPSLRRFFKEGPGWSFPTWQKFHAAYFSHGYLFMITLKPYEDEKILVRFAKVFEQAYTRFLDLQKAEAQSREAQIELGLERVRARAMAMQNSSELSELVAILFDELVKLDLVLARCIIWIFDAETLSAKVWMANSEDKKAADSYYIKRLDHPYYKAIIKAWKEKNPKWVYELKGANKRSIDDLLLNETELSKLPEAVKEGIRSSKQTVVSGSFNNFGFIEASGPLGYTEEQLDILNRFGKVFDLSYTRFNDLQKAEAQAREGQIETGLERVRSRSLAMHHTSELQDVIHTVHRELLKLNIAIHGGSFIAINRDITTTLRCWGSGGTADTSEEVQLPLYEKPFCTNLINRIKNGPGFFTEEYTQKEKREFFTFLFKHEPWSELDAQRKKETLSSPGGYTRSCCVSQHTSIFIINHYGEKFSKPDNDILKRFAKVFEQSYTRFLDLQKAEAQARDAQIEAALEKVRSTSMAMHG
ncbi:MAG TPA: hypothetical protein VGQ53_11915, partial [Chitinophagaceae bacterium]|nr:hypothetical protein [Chitinophagaceae bacterium]